ncbi:MAG TPA: ABC transporter permease subunit [Clostridia bacterium]|nr:ABC transporter permease subunit [Clostridia bacterium]
MVARRNKTLQGTYKKKRFAVDDFDLTCLAIPTILWYILFCYIPMFGVVMAFKNYKVRPGRGFLYSLFVNSKWVGLENFRFLFRGRDAMLMFRNTIGYNLAFIVLGVLIPVTLAILISQLHSKKLAKVTQTSMFLPHFLSWVVVSYFVFAFMSTDKGLINRLLRAAGYVGTTNWYQNQRVWPFVLVFLQVWKTMGYNMVVYLASISGIDGALYEAALIDGAGKAQQVRHITLPLLRPIISIMFILAVGNIFRTDFGLFYQATRNAGAIADVTMTIDVYVYKILMGRSNVNYSSAAALLQSVFGLVTIVLANVAVKRIDPDSGLF